VPARLRHYHRHEGVSAAVGPAVGVPLPEGCPVLGGLPAAPAVFSAPEVLGTPVDERLLRLSW